MNPTLIRKRAAEAKEAARIEMTAAELRNIRNSLGMTQAALAAYMHVSPRTLIRWEHAGLPDGPAVVLYRMLSNWSEAFPIPSA